MNDQAFRLREQMRTTVRERSRVVSFGVLGARNGVGTTTVAAAFALGAARLGFRTLLADRVPGSRDLESLFWHDAVVSRKPSGTTSTIEITSGIFPAAALEIRTNATEPTGADPRFDEPERFERAILDLGTRRDVVADPTDRLEPTLHRLIVVTTAHPWSMASCVEMVASRTVAGLGDRLRIVFNRVDPKKFRLVRQRFEEACHIRCGMVPEIAATLRVLPALESALMPIGPLNVPGTRRERSNTGRRSRRFHLAGYGQDGTVREFETLMPLLFVPKTASSNESASPEDSVSCFDETALPAGMAESDTGEHEGNIVIPTLFRSAA